MTELPKIHREDRAFIRLLGRLLGEVIREQHGAQAFQLVEDIRRQAVGETVRGGDAPTGCSLSQPEMLLLIRAFSIFSQLTTSPTIISHGARSRGPGAPGAWFRIPARPQRVRVIRKTRCSCRDHRPSHRSAAQIHPGPRE